MKDVVPYTNGFKEQMVSRMLGPTAVSANKLGKSVGVPQSTLSKWLRDTGTLASMKTNENEKQANTLKKWTVKDKLRVVAAVEGLEGQALGEFLRQEGLHEAQLKSWCDAAAGALTSAEAASPRALTEQQRRRLTVAEKRVKELERELRRKEKALAEAAALLMLEKKLQILGWDERDRSQDEDAESDGKSEK